MANWTAINHPIYTGGTFTAINHPTATGAKRRRSTPETTKPKLKLAIPFFNPKKKTNKPKLPWEGLLMGDPGSDYGHHQVRLEMVDDMLNLCAASGKYRLAMNWKNQPVFDDSPIEAPVQRKDSCTDVSEGSKGEGSKTEKGSNSDGVEVKFKVEKYTWSVNDSNSVSMEREQANEGTKFGEGDGPAW